MELQLTHSSIAAIIFGSLEMPVWSLIPSKANQTKNGFMFKNEILLELQD